MMTCLACGAELTSLRFGTWRSLFCSRTCWKSGPVTSPLKRALEAEKLARSRLRACPICGVMVDPADRGRRRMYCSKVCTAEAVARKTKAARRARLVERPCNECGEVFLPSDSHTRYCSIPCRKRHGDNLGRERGKPWIVNAYKDTPNRRAHWERRQALIRGATSPGELINRREVFERDGWICGLCHLPVDPALKYPDRMSASLDHVVPVSLGGDHSMANVQCSHLFCNLSKNNHVEEASRDPHDSEALAVLF